MMKSSSLNKSLAPIAMFRKVSLLTIVIAAAGSIAAQTFEIGGQQSQPPQQQATQSAKKKSGKGASAGSASAVQENLEEGSALSFGAGLNVQREVRAADDALKHN